MDSRQVGIDQFDGRKFLCAYTLRHFGEREINDVVQFHLAVLREPQSLTRQAVRLDELLEDWARLTGPLLKEKIRVQRETKSLKTFHVCVHASLWAAR